jgi:hypothetical protein
MKIRKAGAEDRPTDMTKLVVGFRNFAKVPKICNAGELRVPTTFGSVNI